MSTGNVTKVDLLAKIYKLKNSLYDKEQSTTGQWTDGAHDSLNKVLDFLNEYSR